MSESGPSATGGYGPRRLSIELTNICNLHCSYCLRDEDALYHTPANFIPIELLQTIFRRGREVIGLTNVGFTGGEPTLHPKFTQVLQAVANEELKSSFVTNGWHFERIWPTVLTHRDSITHIAFSLDGATREQHDYWRGAGSFVRLVRAFSRCYGNNIPFTFRVTLRRDTAAQLEQLALFAARMGAVSLNFSHVFPTSPDDDALDPHERSRVEQEIANLAKIFKMRIELSVGYHNLDPAAPCSALAGMSANIDYRGRLTLCCNLSGYRGATGADDVIADLHTEDFASAYERLRAVAAGQMEARSARLTALAEQGTAPDLYTASPCLFCLESFGKLPWRTKVASGVRALPVLDVNARASSTSIN